MADRIEKELSRNEFANYLATIAEQLKLSSEKGGNKKQRSQKTKNKIQKFEAKSQ